MAVIIPINLTRQAVSVLRVISLYPSVPAYQNSTNSFEPIIAQQANYTRDTSIVSFGFPHSLDNGYSPTDGYGVFSVPANAYAIGIPSQVYTTNVFSASAANQNFSVLLLDVDCAPIEPGYSRIRVDYIDPLNNRCVDYLDMPFYPTWDTHPREIQEIAEYAEGSLNFLTGNLGTIGNTIYFNAERAMLKALSVSGTVTSTQASSAFTQQAQSHSFDVTYASISKQIKNVKNYFEKYQVNSLKLAQVTGNGITKISPHQTVADSAVTIHVNYTPSHEDKIYLSGYYVNSKIEGNTYIINIPKGLIFNYSLLLDIKRNSISIISNPTYIFINGQPEIKKLNSHGDNNFFESNKLITIHGYNFGDNPGEIYLNDNSIQVSTWNDYEITFILPLNSESGLLKVITKFGNFTSIQINILSEIKLKINTKKKNNILNAKNTIIFESILQDAKVKSRWSLSCGDEKFITGNENVGFINSDGKYISPKIINEDKKVTIYAHYFDGIKSYLSNFDLYLQSKNVKSLPTQYIDEESKNIDNLTVNATDNLNLLSYHINALDSFVLTIVNTLGTGNYFSTTNTSLSGGGTAQGFNTLFANTNTDATYIAYTPATFGFANLIGSIGIADINGNPLNYLPFKITLAVFPSLPIMGTSYNTLTISASAYTFTVGASSLLNANYSNSVASVSNVTGSINLTWFVYLNGVKINNAILGNYFTTNTKGYYNVYSTYNSPQGVIASNNITLKVQ